MPLFSNPVLKSVSDGHYFQTRQWPCSQKSRRFKMAEITAKMVADLRAATGLGMMECKKSLG